MRSYYWNVLRWFRSTSHRSLDRAYEASKRLNSIRTKVFTQAKPFSFEELLSIVETLTDRDFHKSIFRIYWSLLECRLSLLVLKLDRFLEIIFGMKHPESSSLVDTHPINFFFCAKLSVSVFISVSEDSEYSITNAKTPTESQQRSECERGTKNTYLFSERRGLYVFQEQNCL